MGVLDEDAFAAVFRENPDEAMTMLVEMSSATDERLRSTARALARRLVLELARRGVARGRGIGKLRPRPAETGGELDLDASLPALADAAAAKRVPRADELVARHWSRPELALCVVVDTSGSMTGARLTAAALTAAACAWRAPGEHAVVAFARKAEVIRPLRSARSRADVVEAVLQLRGHGVTALASALRAAQDQLASSRAARKVVVLLSDCRATDEEDPVPAARRCAELVVLAPDEDCEQAEQFARQAGARWRPLTGAAAAPEALSALLDPGQ
ncbi:hypothetical protein GCM10022222_05720 [Amycolatopsis ultiminotia]|uniref:VWFA domain-containing protein n=1 Tax=Amycolatopsis ultiminotia TaxID=543629 RepID=A0ABP6V1L9_9PSEU